MSDETALSLLSSIGITLHVGDAMQVLPCDPASDRRTLLATASMEASSSVDVERDSLSGIIRAARDASRTSCELPPCDRAPALDFRTLLARTGRRSVDTPARIWVDLEQAAETLGYEIRDVAPAEANPFINHAQPAHLIEVVSKDDGLVLAGGKGTSRDEALKSALGEFAERWRAVGDTPKNVFAASARDLKAAGFMVPELFAGRRDAYSPNLVLDWVIAWTTDGAAAAIPAERAYYNYRPSSGIRAFAWQHTAGLAAGASLEEAVWAAVTECLERDAYWITMRCRLNRPSLNRDNLLPTCQALDEFLHSSGLQLVLKDCSLDWPLHIVHAAVVDRDRRVPAFSHGMGSGLSVASATVKATLEALQIRSGLQRVAVGGLASSLFPACPREAVHIWSDPASEERLSHLLHDSDQPTAVQASETTIAQALEELRRQVGPIFFAHIGELCGLQVVRAIVPPCILPDPTIEEVPNRLRQWLTSKGLPAPYGDPILT